MSEFIVTNTQHGANFRSASNTTGSFINLPFGTRLELLEDDGTKWKKVSFDGQIGYVSDVNLTFVKSDAIARLVSSCAYFWDLFDRGVGKEMTDPYRGYVEDMWKEIKTGPPKDNNGRMITNHKNWPWSAAAISSFVRRATGYTGFRYGSKHSYFIHNSIRARDNNDTGAPFWGGTN